MRNKLSWVHRPERLSAVREGEEPILAPDRETRLASAGQIGLAVLGLLCHFLLFLLLFFPFIHISSPYFADGPISLTGWNLGYGFFLWTAGYNGILIQENLISSIVPALVILPILSYLACLLSLFLKRGRTNTWLEKSLYLNVLLNMLGFFVIYARLLHAQMAYWRLEGVLVPDTSDDIHRALFLSFAICSSVSSLLLGLLLRQSRTKHR